MPEGYSAGNAYLEILPSFRNIAQTINAEFTRLGRSAGAAFSDTFNQQVQRQTATTSAGPSTSKSAKDGSSSGDAFGKAFKARIDAALSNLPDARIDADTSEADAEIEGIRARLTALRDARIGVDIDEGAAAAELDKLKAELDALGARSPSIRVKVDTAAASADLARLQAQVSALGAESAGAGGAGGGFGAITSGISGMSVAIIGLIPMLGPLAAGLAGVAAGGIAAIGAIGAGAGVAALGLANVPKALDLIKQRATATGPELEKINEQLAGMSPATVTFAGFIQSKLLPQIDKLKDAAAAGLLPGLQDGIQTLMEHMPGLTGFVSTLSTKVGSLFSRLAGALQLPVFQRFFDYMSENAGPILDQVYRIVMNLGGAFASFMTAMGPVTKAIGDVLGDLTGKLANSDAFQKLSDWLMKNGPAIKDFFVSVSTLVGKLVVALAPLGMAIIKGLAGFSAFLASLNPDIIFAVVAALGALVAVFAGPVTAVIAIAVAVASAAAIVAREWGPISEFFKRLWDDIVGAFKTAWGFIQGVWDDVFSFVTGLPGKLASAGAAIWDWVKDRLSDIWSAVKTFFTTTIVSWVTGLAGKLAAAGVAVWDWFKNLLSNVWDGIKTFFTSTVIGWLRGLGDLERSAAAHAWGWFKNLLSDAWDGIKTFFTSTIVGWLQNLGALERGAAVHVWDWFKDLLSDAWGKVKGFFTDTIFGWLSGLSGRISNIVSGMWDGIKDAFKRVINTVIGWWNNFHLSLHIPSNVVTDFLHLAGLGFTIDTPDIPPLARGTDFFAGGAAIVGEQGPELVNLPRGAQVVPATQTASMLANAGVRMMSVVVNLDGRQIGRTVAPVIAGEIQLAGFARR